MERKQSAPRLVRASTKACLDEKKINLTACFRGFYPGLEENDYKEKY